MTVRVVVKDAKGREMVVFEEQDDPNQPGSWALVTTFCDSSVSEARWREFERLAAIEWMRHNGVAHQDEVVTTVIDLTDEGNDTLRTAKHIGPWAAD